MSDFGTRLKEVIDIKGLTNKAFGESIGVKNTVISEFLSGQRPFGGMMIKKFGEIYPEISLNWLLFGNGPMSFNQKSEDVHIIVEEPIKLYLTDDPGKMMLMRYLDDGDVREKIREILK